LRLFSFGGYGLAIAALALVVLVLMTATRRRSASDSLQNKTYSDKIIAESTFFK